MDYLPQHVFQSLLACRDWKAKNNYISQTHLKLEFHPADDVGETYLEVSAVRHGEPPFFTGANSSRGGLILGLAAVLEVPHSTDCLLNQRQHIFVLYNLIVIIIM